MEKVIAVIQARMGSTRLPRKVMLDLSGKPVLWHVVKRIQGSKLLDEIIVATSEDSSNDVIREFCAEHQIKCYSGSEEDVLDRFFQAARALKLEPQNLVVRITADCPLIDPDVVDQTIGALKQHQVDYASNTINPTYPDGLDCEVMTFSSLQRAWQEAKMRSEREHVTPYIYKHPELFTLLNVTNSEDLSSFRLTLDQEEDYKLIEWIYLNLYKENNLFLMDEILDLLKRHPEKSGINLAIKRNEGLFKSVKNDERVQ